MNHGTQAAVATLPFSTEDAFRTRCLVILELLAQACGADFDSPLARECLLRAESDLPGSWATSWQVRLNQVSTELGFSVQTAQMTFDQARKLAQKKLPLATLAMGSEEFGSWIFLDGDRTGVSRLGDEEPIVWVDTAEAKTLLDQQGEHSWKGEAPAEPRSEPETPAKELNSSLAFQAQSVARQEPRLPKKDKIPEGDVSLTWLTIQPQLLSEPIKKAPKEEAHHGPSPLSRLLSLLNQDRNDLWVIVLFSIGVGVFSLATPIAVEAIVGTVQGGTQILLQPVLALSVVLLVFLGLAALLRVFQAVVVEFLQQRIFVRVSLDLANRLPQVRAEAFDGQHGPELVNRFFDVLTVQKASAVLLLDGISVVLQTAIGLTVLAFFNPYLLGFDLVLILALGFIIFVLGRGAVRTSIKESYAKYDVAAWLEEMARNPLTFKMGGGRVFALSRANHLAGGYVKARKAHFKILFRQILFALILQAVASAALFGLGGWLVINRSLTLGQLVAAELILTMIVGSFLKLGKSLESIYDLLAAMDKLGHLIDLPLEKASGDNLPRLSSPLSVSVRDLTVGFSETPGRKTFTDFSLDIAAGEKVALIGPHGSGKSMLLDLLYGLREPESGRIELDGQDIRTLRPESLRSQVGVVKGQEIFAGTILDNVTLGRAIATEEVVKALEIVGLRGEIMEQPDGLETRLSGGGSPLSFGQVRRLMLARALVGRPRLLLVDEVLDDIHEEVRGQVLDALLDPKAPWTLLLVTHLADIAARCDRQVRLTTPTKRTIQKHLERPELR